MNCTNSIKLIKEYEKSVRMLNGTFISSFPPRIFWSLSSTTVRNFFVSLYHTITTVCKNGWFLSRLRIPAYSIPHADNIKHTAMLCIDSFEIRRRPMAALILPLSALFLLSLVTRLTVFVLFQTKKTTGIIPRKKPKFFTICGLNLVFLAIFSLTDVVRYQYILLST